MIKTQYFTLEESSIPNKYLIKFNAHDFDSVTTKGSYNVLMARFLGLSYAQFLRLCRDVCGAEIYGKNTKYPLPYFTRNVETTKLLRMLNSYANCAVMARKAGTIVPVEEVTNVFNSK